MTEHCSLVLSVDNWSFQEQFLVDGGGAGLFAVSLVKGRSRVRKRTWGHRPALEDDS